MFSLLLYSLLQLEDTVDSKSRFRDTNQPTEQKTLGLAVLSGLYEQAQLKGTPYL